VAAKDRERKPWNITILRALNPNGSLLWPDYWDLATMRDLYWSGGSASFLATYMQDPSGLAGAVFNPDWFQYFAPAGYVDENGVGAVDLVKRGIIQRVLPTDEVLGSAMGVDLAVGDKESADYYGRFHTLSSRAGDVYVIDVYQGHLSTGDLLDDIAMARTKHHVRAIGVAEDLMEKTLSGLFKTAARIPNGPRYAQLPWVPVPHKGLDKVTRARAFALKYEQHRVYHLYGARWLTMWESQAAGFPGTAHDDMVDAAVCCDWVMGQYDPRDAGTLAELAADLANPRDMPLDIGTGVTERGWPQDFERWNP
jgi:predicted phage terminase large subunit-like protein